MARAHIAAVALVSLLVLLVFKAEVEARRHGALRRRKREWILPPTKLLENVDYTKRVSIAKIRSDKDDEQRVHYTLTGAGADKDPFNLFIVNETSGHVRVTGILDREKFSVYNLTGIARYSDGSLAETDIDLRIRVIDQNDNSPKFGKKFTGSVNESSTLVTQVIATDADEEGTDNAKIAYSIVKQEPVDPGVMFYIEKNSGKIFVNDAGLDRELHDLYTLTIKATDMDGAENGNSEIGTAEIKILDINDNPPRLEKDMYSGNVDENTDNVVVMRIKALDDDLVNTDNWLADFKIDKGNEDGLFSIETDPKTNEGILKLIKPIDFEKIKDLDLGVSVENVAPLVVGAGDRADIDFGLDLGLDLT
ncbi:hypothetical protein AAFF_G00219540 [Aldrovandia affinis]|uniref:Cadherin domain-containing protein n=1 Tax=Aldrovandia affinis TaxID=143900 RepID=A0AAD7RG49_9TELE|nr:hypothetical protein AAFF_G00219540 [Aldrovandia affinis]